MERSSRISTRAGSRTTIGDGSKTEFGQKVKKFPSESRLSVTCAKCSVLVIVGSAGLGSRSHVGLSNSGNLALPMDTMMSVGRVAIVFVRSRQHPQTTDS